MIKEIIEEILQAIEDSFVTIAKDDYISYTQVSDLEFKPFEHTL